MMSNYAAELFHIDSLPMRCGGSSFLIDEELQ